MQEEVENRTVTLSINTAKMTGRVLKQAISKYLAYRKNKSKTKSQTNVKPTGKQSVKELIGQNQGVTNVEIEDKDIKEFERIARKYGVDYAIKKDKTADMPKYLVFFKTRDGDALNEAMNEFAYKQLKKKEKPSLLKKLKSLGELVKNREPKVRNKNKEMEL
ncbi:MAG: PcfB family protein [Firmicutes bacterium]|nr:PcfB family protein [Bacillota bacterium]